MKNYIWALVIDPAATIIETDLRDINPHDLNDLKNIIGGNINAVYGYRNADGTLGERRIMFYHSETHRSHGLPLNRLATDLWWFYNPYAANIALLGGPVVVTGHQPPGRGTGGCDRDAPEDLLHTYIGLITGSIDTPPPD